MPEEPTLVQPGLADRIPLLVPVAVVPAAGARFTSGGKRPLEDASGSSLPPDVGHGIPLLVSASTP